MSEMKIKVESVEDENAEASSNAPAPGQPVATKSQRRPSIAFLIIASMFLLIGALVVYLVNDRRKLEQEIKSLSSQQVKQDNSRDEAAKLAAEVGKVIELPSDEVPTVATVVDVNKVKEQPFFANAQNGDKVLLYAKSSKAVLYRPLTSKVIEVAPINLGSNQSRATVTDQ